MSGAYRMVGPGCRDRRDTLVITTRSTPVYTGGDQRGCVQASSHLAEPPGHTRARWAVIITPATPPFVTPVQHPLFNTPNNDRRRHASKRSILPLARG